METQLASGHDPLSKEIKSKSESIQSMWTGHQLAITRIYRYNVH